MSSERTILLPVADVGDVDVRRRGRGGKLHVVAALVFVFLLVATLVLISKKTDQDAKKHKNVSSDQPKNSSRGIQTLLSVLQLEEADDSGCHARQGTCQEENHACSGHYVSNLCSGHASRRCCVPVHHSSNLDCSGSGHRYSATGTGYYPDSSPIEGGYVDMHGKPLHTLQDFLDGVSSVVVVAMDNRAGIAYDTPVCIPELNHKYHRVIDFRVRDTGSAFYGKGHSRIDICVRNRAASFDNTINGHLTLVM